MTPIYGHRGARGERPENSIAGFLHARAAGVAGIETDIAMTADLVPVLHHDPELPDGRALRDLPHAALRGIPTLAEALRAVPDVDWLLEIKSYPSTPGRGQPPELLVQGVCEALAAAAVPPARVMVLAFEWAVLARVRAVAPALRRVCLTAPEPAADRDLWWRPGFAGHSVPQAVASTGAWAWAPDHADLTAAAIAEAHALGLKVIPWTVNEPADFARLAPRADGLITDFPSRFTGDFRPPWRPRTPKS